MSFFILSEPGYKTSNWHRNILDGLIAQKQQKRLNMITLNSLEELHQHTTDTKDAIFLVGNDSEWIDQVTAACEKVFDNRVVVLGNHVSQLNKHKYSVVSSDIFSEIKTLYKYLQYYGQKRIAMYGINPQSASDSFKKASFLACGASEADLFYNTGSLAQCFERFASRADSYDGVICVNDYAAISLAMHLKPHQKLFITSCGGNMLADFFVPSITHTRSDYEAFGRTGIDLCRLLQKNSTINSIHICLAGKFVAGETTKNLPLIADWNPGSSQSYQEDPCSAGAHISLPCSTNSAGCNHHDMFYTDSETREMLKIEALLNTCSGDDLQILEHIINNETYANIAEIFYISINGVQYKLKNWFDLCEVSSKKEFITMLKKYKNSI